jgi:hypothetical protein
MFLKIPKFHSPFQRFLTNKRGVLVPGDPPPPPLDPCLNAGTAADENGRKLLKVPRNSTIQHK